MQYFSSSVSLKGERRALTSFHAQFYISLASTRWEIVLPTHRKNHTHSRLPCFSLVLALAFASGSNATADVIVVMPHDMLECQSYMAAYSLTCASFTYVIKHSTVMYWPKGADTLQLLTMLASTVLSFRLSTLIGFIDLLYAT